jgi:hypothetical protein
MFELMPDRATQNPVGSASSLARDLVVARLDTRGKRSEDMTADADHEIMTTRTRAGFMVIALFIVGFARPADACPAKSPCLKYKTRVVEIQPLYYVRDASSPLPRFSEKNVTRFLMLSLWTPVFADSNVPMAPPARGVQVVKDARKVRFVDPEHVPPPRTNARDAYAGQIMHTDGFTYVDVYGQTFLLTKCAKDKRRACLEPFTAPPAP